MREKYCWAGWSWWLEWCERKILLGWSWSWLSNGVNLNVFEKSILLSVLGIPTKQNLKGGSGYAHASDDNFSYVIPR